MLPSLAAQTVAGVRIVVVDNGSSDGTAEWLREHWPRVDVVRLEDNVGVAAALNVCLRVGAGGEFVALFNNDTELAPDCLAELVRALREDPSAGSAAAKLIDFYDREVLDGAGDGFVWRGTSYRRGHGDEDVGQYDDTARVFGACGGAALYRVSAVGLVGGFDERFYAFSEDADWSFRSQLAGLGCRFVPSAVVFHMGSATLGKGMTDFTRYHLWRNAIWIVAKGYPAAALVRHGHELALNQALTFADAARAGKLRLWWRAVRDALRALPGVLGDRRRVQATRRATLPELDEVIEPAHVELRRTRARRRQAAGARTPSGLTAGRTRR